MRTGYEIEVTQADIDEGVRGNVCYCMVSTAIARLNPNATHIQVDMKTIRYSEVVGGIRKRVVFETPRKVREYILAFDAGEVTRPFSFVLEKPEITDAPGRKPGTATTASFKAKEAGSGERRSLRVFGERAFRVNQPVGS